MVSHLSIYHLLQSPEGPPRHEYPPTLGYLKRKRKEGGKYLAISNQHKLRTRTRRIKRIHRTRHRRDPLLHRTRIAHAAARRLPATGRVANRLGGRARVRVENQVDDGGCGAIACAGGRFARAKNVNVGTGAAVDICRAGGGGEEGGGVGEGQG